MRGSGTIAAALAAILLGGAALAGAQAPAQAPEQPPAPVRSPAPSATAPAPAAVAAVADTAAGPAVRPTLAVAMTPLWPGWGQLYTGDGWRAALAYGVQMLYWTQLLMNDQKAARSKDFAATMELPEARLGYDARTQEYRERVRDYAWWSAGGMLIIALDAYVNAHLHRFDQDPVPVPDDWRTLPEAAAGPAAAGPEGRVVWAWSTGF